MIRHLCRPDRILIGDVAEIFTGNPYVVLPPPWSDILNAIPLP